MVAIQISSTLSELAAKLLRASESSAALIEAGLVMTAEDVEQIAVAAIKEMTPYRTGQLRDSTVAERVETPEGVTLAIHQTRTTQWHGEDFPIAEFLIHGHGEYDVYPVDKEALAWPGGGHPVKHVHIPAMDPNPYPQLAMAAASGALEASMLQGAIRTGGLITGSLR